MRHIVFDTETTGLHAEGDDRIVEIGAVELVNYVPTGRTYHQYINPERKIDPGAMAVHGITDEQVADKPVYAEIIQSFEEFIQDSILVAHNAEFDMRFINAEYRRLGLPPLPPNRFLDTLVMARKMFPGAPNSLDALCRRYNVDNSGRVFHGALLDSQLLAEVFLELAGGRQPELLGGGKTAGAATSQAQAEEDNVGVLWPAREWPIAPEEQEAHAAMVATIKDALWTRDA